MLGVERPRSAPVEDQIGVRKDPSWRHVITAPARLAGRNVAAAEVLPRSVGARQHEAQLLHVGIAIDDDEDLRPVDVLIADGDRGPRQRNPRLPLGEVSTIAATSRVSAARKRAASPSTSTDGDCGSALVIATLVGSSLAAPRRGAGAWTQPATIRSTPVIATNLRIG